MSGKQIEFLLVVLYRVLSYDNDVKSTTGHVVPGHLPATGSTSVTPTGAVVVQGINQAILACANTLQFSPTLLIPSEQAIRT
jgi:hypothetical protein